MAAGTRRLNRNATRGHGPRVFQFTFGLRANPAGASAPARWHSRLVAIPIAIATLVLGFFSLAILAVMIPIALSVGAIAWWWLRRKASRAWSSSDALEGEYAVVDPAPRSAGTPEIAPREGGPPGSPQ